MPWGNGEEEVVWEVEMGKYRRSNGTDLEVSERIERGKAGRAVVVA